MQCPLKAVSGKPCQAMWEIGTNEPQVCPGGVHSLVGTQRVKQTAQPNMSNPSLRDRDLGAREQKWGQREGRDQYALSANPG